MQRLLRHSLPIQALASVVAIAILCFVSAFGSGMLAWVSEADGQAINTAGSIRMATYRINFQIATDFEADSPANLSIAVDSENILKSSSDAEIIAANRLNGNSQSEAHKISALIQDMENRLASLRTYQQAYANKHTVINEQLKRIELQWYNRLKPILLSSNKDNFYTASPAYIEDVDGFVSALQYRNEQRQTWQQVLQIVSLLITIIIMLVGIYKLRQNVLSPVQRLIKANSLFKEGKSKTRVAITGYSEFKALGDSFNDMASTIEAYQHSLESEVAIKTKHLVKANHALSLFYEFSKQLTTSPVSLHKLDNLITDFGNIFSHLDFTLCIQSGLLNDKDSIALHDDKMRELCTKLTCDNCLIKEDSHTQSYPIVHQDFEFGELRVRPKSVLMTHSRTPSSDKDQKGNPKGSRIEMVDAENTYLDHRNSELIVALTNLVSTALSLRRQRQQEHQLILLEERTTIARELHDSLAQSLSYLKIQVSVLEKHLKTLTDNGRELASDEANQLSVWQHIAQIKNGLSSAYQELRDLLTTFRLTIDSDNFDEALYEAADEFAAKGGFDITVNNQILSINLTAAEQVHLIQIIREALSNVSRHAKANTVKVHLGYDDESNYIAMQITDDGIGISRTVNQTQHHGLMIMKERAYKLGGDLIITDNESVEAKGTSVIVRFVPSFFDDYMTVQASSPKD